MINRGSAQMWALARMSHQNEHRLLYGHFYFFRTLFTFGSKPFQLDLLSGIPRFLEPIVSRKV